MDFNQKYFGLKLSTWIVIVVLIITIIICKKCEPFTSVKSEEKVVEEVVKVYNFNTTWCGFSVQFQPIWDEFSKLVSESRNIQTFDIKCDDHEDPKVKELCDRYNIEGFPTIIFEKGDKKEVHNGERSVEALKTHAESM